MLANVDFSASQSSIKLTGTRSLLQMFNHIQQMLNWIEILRLGSPLQKAEFTVMFMELFLDISAYVARGITLLKNIPPQLCLHAVKDVPDWEKHSAVLWH